MSRPRQTEYPRKLPQPTQRRGGQMWELRIRVPEEARGRRFKGTHTSRSLETRDKADACRKLPEVYIALLKEFDVEVEWLRTDPPGVSVAEAQAKTGQILAVSEVCRLRRASIIESARQSRKEGTAALLRPGSAVDVKQIAIRYRGDLRNRIDNARARLTVQDFHHQKWFLTYLSKSGIGDVADPDLAEAALAKTEIDVLTEILNDDMTLWPDLGTSALPASTFERTDSSPTLVQIQTSYLSARRGELAAERVALIGACVRDFNKIVGGDRPVTDYGKADALRFIDTLLMLPANWTKNRALRHLGIVAAAEEAKRLGMPRQLPKTLRKKIAILSALFAFASDRHEGVTIKFPTNGLPKGGPANEDKDAFTSDELRVLLTSSTSGNLFWLTWLGLYTGARLNEICQLSTHNIQQHGKQWFINFAPPMRLKNRASERSVPIHSKLVELGFIDFARNQNGDLFPGIARHASGRLSDAQSKAYRRHLEKSGLKRPKLSFHSLRHTLITRLKTVAPRETETRLRLCGHTLTGMSGRYGSSYAAEAADMDLPWLG